MKNKFLKRAIASAGAVCCSLCLLASPMAATSVEASETTKISGEVSQEEMVSIGNPAEPCRDVKTWVYKKALGKLWKRLWNGTKCCWESDWLYVRDL